MIQKKYSIGIIVVILTVIIFVIIEIPNNEEIESNQEEKNIKTESKIPDTIIFWDKNRPLTLDDFQGIISGSNAEDDEVVAQSNVGFWLPPFLEIKITTNGFCQYEFQNYTVLAHFNKAKSWINLEKVERSNSYNQMLDHEQRHFDIVEIYSKILIKIINDEFRNKKFPCPNVNNASSESSAIEDAQQRVSQLESMINSKYLKDQDVYEQEAGRREFSEQQKKWDAKIDECLDMDLNEIEQCLDLYSR